MWHLHWSCFVAPFFRRTTPLQWEFSGPALRLARSPLFPPRSQSLNASPGVCLASLLRRWERMGRCCAGYPWCCETWWSSWIKTVNWTSDAFPSLLPRPSSIFRPSSRPPPVCCTPLMTKCFRLSRRRNAAQRLVSSLRLRGEDQAAEAAVGQRGEGGPWARARCPDRGLPA